MLPSSDCTIPASLFGTTFITPQVVDRGVATVPADPAMVRPLFCKKKNTNKSFLLYNNYQKKRSVATWDRTRAGRVFFFGVYSWLVMTFNYLILWVRVKGQG